MVSKCSSWVNVLCYFPSLTKATAVQQFRNKVILLCISTVIFRLLLHQLIWKAAYLSLTSNILPVLKNPAFFSLLSVNRTFSVTLPSFSSNTKPSPYLEGPGEPAEQLLRSRRASSIRLCFLPLNGAAGATTPSVFICVCVTETERGRVCVCVVLRDQTGSCVCVSITSALRFKYLLIWGIMEMSLCVCLFLKACFASRCYIYLRDKNRAKFGGKGGNPPSQRTLWSMGGWFHQIMSRGLHVVPLKGVWPLDVFPFYCFYKLNVYNLGRLTRILQKNQTL